MGVCMGGGGGNSAYSFLRSVLMREGKDVIGKYLISLQSSNG